MRNEETEINFTGIILRQSEAAIFFKGRTWRDDEAVWLPKSQIAIIVRSEREGFRPGEVTVCVPEWLAEKKEMA